MNKLPTINIRTLLAFVHDATAAVAAWIIAYWLRFNLAIPEQFFASMAQSIVWVVPLQTLIFWRFGLYRGIWRYASLPDLRRIALAVGVSALVIPFVYLMLRPYVTIPRSVLVLDPILLILIMGGSRVFYRSWKELYAFRSEKQKGVPVLILGGGETAMALVKEFSRQRVWRPVGILEDNPKKHGRLIHDVEVLGTLEAVKTLSERLGVTHAIIAMPSADAATRRRAVALCAAAGVSTFTVPSFGDLVSGKVTVSQIRAVEIEDLLGRDPVTLDNDGLHRLLTDRVAMVTGAGGSIGSELCRQIARYDPTLLVLVEQSEFALFTMEQEFLSQFPALPIAAVIGDAKNRARMSQIISKYRPSAIFHAAAYKHVPLMEVDNTWEAVRNNVFGTYTLAAAAIEYEVDKFVLISTDKAVNPTNVMGASKRLAEMVCQALQADHKTRFVMVRFGNVLGSTGSVIPKFHEQIAKGGPVTVTHPDITRYFMSISEASQLVLQAGLMGTGGEIFVLDMGEPVRIADLARDMIRLSGYSEEEIEIVFTGLRPGEKLYEELLADDEGTLPTPHAKLRIAKARTADSAWLGELLQWLQTDVIRSDEELRAELRRWVPEYRPAQHSNVIEFKERRSKAR